jgi:cytidylate kinase
MLTRKEEPMYRVLTVAREYGSGGGDIARTISERLGWPLLDRSIIMEIAREAKVDPDLARRYDERVDSWLHRISRTALWHGAFDGVAAVTDTDFFDAETMASLSRRLIEESYEKGPCVIVGRGAQCILQNRKEAFHVFIYAPWAERVARVRRRAPDGTDIVELLHTTDRQRADYVQVHYGCPWRDPHLYHLLISSELGEEVTASIIIHALGLGSRLDHPVF